MVLFAFRINGSGCFCPYNGSDRTGPRDLRHGSAILFPRTPPLIPLLIADFFRNSCFRFLLGDQTPSLGDQIVCSCYLSPSISFFIRHGCSAVCSVFCVSFVSKLYRSRANSRSPTSTDRHRLEDAAATINNFSVVVSFLLFCSTRGIMQEV